MAVQCFFSPQWPFEVLQPKPIWPRKQSTMIQKKKNCVKLLTGILWTETQFLINLYVEKIPRTRFIPSMICCVSARSDWLLRPEPSRVFQRPDGRRHYSTRRHVGSVGCIMWRQLKAQNFFYYMHGISNPIKMTGLPYWRLGGACWLHLMSLMGLTSFGSQCLALPHLRPLPSYQSLFFATHHFAVINDSCWSCQVQVIGIDLARPPGVMVLPLNFAYWVGKMTSRRCETCFSVMAFS